MPTQTNFSGSRGTINWETFSYGLQHGHFSSYFLLVALGVIATVAFWAGSNTMRKDTRR
jgi:hypothetical protein